MMSIVVDDTTYGKAPLSLVNIIVKGNSYLSAKDDQRMRIWRKVRNLRDQLETGLTRSK